MKNISINVVGIGAESYPNGTTPLEILSSTKGIAKDTIICKVDDILTDLSTSLTGDATVQFLDGKSKDGHSVLLHSTAHLMAQAVKRLYPKTKVTIGPYLENRFYYDFDVETPFTEQDLLKIEKEMLKISQENLEIVHEVKSRKEALKFFKKIGEDYKVEIINDLDKSEVLKVYAQGDFTDLCRGPHVPSTGTIQHFKLLSSSAAYWRGDENNQTLQRVYGTSFTSAKELKKYLLMLEEQKKRDHRKIGKELDLYFHDEEVGPGLPLWTPNGAVIIDELEALAKEKEDLGGYKRVRTPHLTKGALYEKSGHLEHYRSSMYPAMDVDGTDYYMKPMNCPHHHKIYANTPKSYRDLPYRLSEYGTCYRYEKSGELFGLMRVRSMQMNDAHIYCTEDQFKEEFIAVCNLYMDYFKIFGIEKYEMRLGLHDSKGLGKKYINNPKLWKKTEDDVINALKDAGLKITTPRGKILKILEGSSLRHISADEIYKQLIKSGEDVGIATVYRVLTQFETAGIVQRHNFDSGHAVFEMAKEEHHDHMVRVDTGEVIEFFDDEIERLQREIVDRHGCRLYSDCLTIQGAHSSAICDCSVHISCVLHSMLILVS